MGFLGFKFDISNIGEVEFDAKKYFSKFIVILVETNRIKDKRILIVGKENFLKKEDCSFIHFNKNLEFKEFLMIENPNFLYSKICVSDKKIVDFEFLTFWFDAKKFKEIYSQFLVRDEDELNDKFFQIKVNNIFNLII